MSDKRGPGGPGSIPFRMRVGVTGHRDLPDDASLQARIREALDRVPGLIPNVRHTPLVFTAISALAEGADRLVAREILSRPGGDLEAVLPLPSKEYATDFQSERSREEFERLLESASSVEAGPLLGSREEAYERAGRQVVRRADILIALWDGEASGGQGGTAEIVAYALGQGVPTIWIHTEGGGRTELHSGLGLRQERAGTLRSIQRFEAARLPRRLAARNIGTHATLVRPDIPATGELPVGTLAAWVQPGFVRADLLALRYRNWFFGLAYTVIVLALAAVATAGAEAVFFPARPRFALVELGLLTALLAIVAAERVVRIHDRWIDCRLLAERLRSSFFLALTGLNLREHAEGPPGDEPDAIAADWTSQAHEELWRLRPPFAPTEADVPALREYLSAVWIADQIRYHTKRRGRLGRWHQVLHRTAEILFGLTFVAALLHGLERTEAPEIAVSASAHWLTFASIALPAIGAAVTGVVGQREFQRHAERNRRMVRNLARRTRDLLEAESLERLRAVAAEIARNALEENSDWRGVEWIHEMEPPY